MAGRIQIERIENLLKTTTFSVENVAFSVAAPKQMPVDLMQHQRLRCGDWVTVLPVWNNHAVLIRQPRIGSESFVLETPGGGMQEGERDPTVAVARELEEETGLQSRRILSLASVNPNPAIMSNKCHFFLALDCEPAGKRQHFPDHEEMIEPVIVPTAMLEEKVRYGEIDHGLSALCIMLALKYLN